MNHPEPSLGDLSSIMKVAEIESATLKELPITEPIKQQDSSKVEYNNMVNNNNHQNNLQPTQTNSNNIKKIFNETNIGTMLNHMANNPTDVSKVMENSKGNLGSEVEEQARRIARNGQGEQIMKEMQRRGMDPDAMKKQFLQQQRMAKGLPTKSTDAKQKILHITKSRQLKTREIIVNEIKTAAVGILHTESPVSSSCSRLAIGPLQGKEIKIWYDPNAIGKNRRATKIAGFPICGELIIVVDNFDLNESNLKIVENLLE